MKVSGLNTQQVGDQIAQVVNFYVVSFDFGLKTQLWTFFIF